MAFMKVKKESDREGTVYVFKMVLDCGTVVYKIGITTRDRVEDRLSEVLMSFFSRYRYVPRTSVKKFKKVKGYLKFEKELHEHYKECKYPFSTKFSGCTEFFHGINEEELLMRYEDILSKV